MPLLGFWKPASYWSLPPSCPLSQPRAAVRLSLQLRCVSVHISLFLICATLIHARIWKSIPPPIAGVMSLLLRGLAKCKLQSARPPPGLWWQLHWDDITVSHNSLSPAQQSLHHPCNSGCWVLLIMGKYSFRHRTVFLYGHRHPEGQRHWPTPLHWPSDMPNIPYNTPAPVDDTSTLVFLFKCAKNLDLDLSENVHFAHSCCSKPEDLANN